MVTAEERERRTPSSRCTLQWGSHSRLDKFLIVLVTSLLLAVDLAISDESGDTSQTTCLSDNCNNTASKMSKSLDRMVDPCDDFYSFACGGWIQNSTIPEGLSKWGILDRLQLRNMQIVQNALDKIDLEKVESKAEQKARIYYDACLDKETIEALGGTPLQKLIRDVGGWNITASGFQLQKFNLETTLHKLFERYPTAALFSWSVLRDTRNSSKNVIYISEISFEMPTRNNYLNKIENKKILDAYLEFMTKISVLLGANETDARTQMLDVIEFETDLANITTPSEIRRSGEELYNTMSIQELQELSPFINWLDYFNNVFRIVSRKITTKERVVVFPKEYLVKLNTLVKGYAETEKGKNTLNNYLIWQAVRSLSSYLSEDFSDAEDALKNAIIGSESGEVMADSQDGEEMIDSEGDETVTDSGIGVEMTDSEDGEAMTDSEGDETVTDSKIGEEMTDSEGGEAMSNSEGGEAMTGSKGSKGQRLYCAIHTDEAIGLATGAMFVRESFGEESKLEAEKMFENIRGAFKKNLQSLSWLDKETRDQAILKEDAISILIGYPDYILNSQKLDKEYFELDVKPNEYFQNNIEVGLFEMRKILKTLGEPVDRTDWTTTPATANAIYDPFKNQICFSAGILQFPYSVKNPRSINYGSIGTMMGHELTHAFDDQGRGYDGSGNLNNWWTNDSIQQFDLRSECIIDQYSNYSEEGLQLNGISSIDENIADNGGLKSAFHAYLEYSKTAPKNYTLPGLDYSHRQLFFISYAQIWCEAKSKKEQAAFRLESDEHSLNKYRVIGSLSNLPEFSQEFSCPLGSNMNPVKKCGVW